MIVARWSAGEDVGQVTITDGAHAGAVIPFDAVYVAPVQLAHR